MKDVDYGLEEWRYARWYEQSTRELAETMAKDSEVKPITYTNSTFIFKSEFEWTPISSQLIDADIETDLLGGFD